jgi:hypothetical protein
MSRLVSTPSWCANSLSSGFFEVSKKQSIEQIFDLIQEELRSPNLASGELNL